MHTVVLGWFGFSAVWFIPLFWRLVKSMLPGGGGLAGPGSIRLWLGFFAVMIASCTLGTALPGGDAASNALGQLLAAGFERVLGHIGTPLAMVVLLFLGLPWLLGIGWRQLNTWLDASFGVSLPQGGGDDEPRGVADLPRASLQRDDDRRVRRAGDVQPTSAHTVNSMAPKQNGRYTRPTLWRPTQASRDERRGRQGVGAPAVQAKRNEPVAPAGWLKSGTSTRAATPVDPARAARMSATGLPAAGLPAAGIPAAGAVTPRGAVVTPAGVPARPAVKPATTLAPAMGERARAATEAAPVRRTPPAAHADAGAATTQQRPLQPAALRSVAAAQPPIRKAATAQPVLPTRTTPPAASDAARKRAAVTPARAPLYAWADKPAQKIAPAPSVHETLRSIEASTAQWAALAGAAGAASSTAAASSGLSAATAVAPAAAIAAGLHAAGAMSVDSFEHGATGAGEALASPAVAHVDAPAIDYAEGDTTASTEAGAANVASGWRHAEAAGATADVEPTMDGDHAATVSAIDGTAPTADEASTSLDSAASGFVPDTVEAGPGATDLPEASEVIDLSFVFDQPSFGIPPLIDPDVATAAVQAAPLAPPASSLSGMSGNLESGTPLDADDHAPATRVTASDDAGQAGTTGQTDVRAPRLAATTDAAPAGAAKTDAEAADAAHTVRSLQSPLTSPTSHASDSTTRAGRIEPVSAPIPLAPWDDAPSGNAPLTSHQTIHASNPDRIEIRPVASSSVTGQATAPTGRVDDADAPRPVAPSPNVPQYIASSAPEAKPVSASATADASGPAPAAFGVAAALPAAQPGASLTSAAGAVAAQPAPNASGAPMVASDSVQQPDPTAQAASSTPSVNGSSSFAAASATAASGARPTSSDPLRVDAALPVASASSAAPAATQATSHIAPPVASPVAGAPATGIPVASVFAGIGAGPTAATGVTAASGSSSNPAVHGITGMHAPATSPTGVPIPSTSGVSTSAPAASPTAPSAPAPSLATSPAATSGSASVSAYQPTPASATTPASGSGLPSHAAPNAPATGMSSVTSPLSGAPGTPAPTATAPSGDLPQPAPTPPATTAGTSYAAAPLSNVSGMAAPAPYQASAPTPTASGTSGLPAQTTPNAHPTISGTLPAAAPFAGVLGAIAPVTATADAQSTPTQATPNAQPIPPATAAPLPDAAAPIVATPLVADAPPARPPGPNAFEFRAPAASLVELPTTDLLEPASDDVETISEEALAQTGLVIEQRLQEFKVPVTVVGASAGPVITRFEIEPALGVRGSQIVGLMKDLSRGLGLTSIRVVETIPGKTCMGLELPNAKRQTIRLSEILASRQYEHSASQLTLAMGKDIVGNPVVTDLAKAPHMLVAGTTGSGKSVGINAMIVSLLYKATPEDVRLIMIDPKMLELSVYEGIPHLLAPVVTDMKLAANALNWCVGEMEKRYRLMSAVGVRNLAGFNQKIRDAEAKEKKIGNPFSLTPDAPEPLSTLPLIVVVIDELADLMMVAGKKIEELIARLAQKARAAGIHLILATQRPSVDVITGLIKANIPTRVAFQVSSKIDSRTILDQMGAESLLGQGDMLFLPPGTGYPQRVHGAFVADEEVHRIVEYLKQFGEPQYEEGILDGPASEGAAQDLFGEAPDAEADPLYDEAVAFVVRTRRASISSVQRQLRIGYNRAARLVEQMEAAGLVSPMGINGSREVLAPPLPD